MSINGHVEGADKQGRKSRVADQQTELEDGQATPRWGARSEAGQEAGIHQGWYTQGASEMCTSRAKQEDR